MATRSRPVISETINRPTITEEMEPVTSTQEDQIRSYRRMARLCYEAQRRLNNSRGRTLERQLNPEAELKLSQRQRASLVPAETLYSTNWSEPRHRVYQHYSETRILVIGGQQNLPLINQESFSRIRQEGMQLIHLGLVMIRIHALHRRNAGVNALVVLRDTRWRDDRSIIGTMEIDLTGGTQLVYIAPNMLLSIEDFYNHIELAIQTHGYEEWNSAESNLLITRGLIGRLTNTSYAGFRYNVQNVADYLASTGIHAVAASPRSIAELQGMRWILQPPAGSQIRNPQEVRTSTLLDGSVALTFQGYKATKRQEPRRISSFDTERTTDEGEEEFAGVLVGELSLPSETPLHEYPNWDTDDEEEERQQVRRRKNKNIFKEGRWDILGEPSGKYDYMVRYDIPNSFFETEMPPPTGWEDNEATIPKVIISEAVFPNIWEDTPWEDDPEFELEDLPTPPREEYFQENEEDDDDREAYFLGLENLENEYPSLSPTTFLQQPQWDDEDGASDEYWQNVVEQVERIKEHYEAEQAMNNEVRRLSIHDETTSQEGNEPNDWLPYAGQSNEAAHMGTDSIMEQLETLDYPILRSKLSARTN
ncbi:hypothetical protein ZIOFF_028984 [Zingiber officinale]|uniref:Uncharacterized protein n=1 Tax=Zingiber officinale TaxID=94328 RepID=A0A8J5GQS3_ZINOF|nr:hypothetical protein ZIOFF_028984 [Zingiber officinale]